MIAQLGRTFSGRSSLQQPPADASAELSGKLRHAPRSGPANHFHLIHAALQFPPPFRIDK